MRRYFPDALIVGLLFLLPLIMFGQQTLGGKTLIPTENLYQYEPYASYKEVVNAPDVPHNHLVSDLILQNYQWKSFIRQNVEDGEVPLWNPHQFSGIPFMAAGQQSTLYPMSILYYIVPLHLAYGWFTVFNLWLAGVFMYAFLRGLNINRIGGLIAGITYQLNGTFIASAVFPMIIGAIVWLPLILLMTEFIIQKRSLFGRHSQALWVIIGAGALGCNILAGHVEITIYTLLIAGYYSAFRLLWDWWQTRNVGDLFKSGSWLIVMVALGLGLGAIQLIPLYEVADNNWRAERSELDVVLGYAHPMRDFLQFALPNFYGSPAHHSYFDVFAMETVPVTINALGETITHTEWGIKNYVEGALYLGILPLILAGFAFVDKSMRRNTLLFGLLTLLSLTFMFGLPTYALIYYLPGINQLNSPFRWIFGVTVGVSVLAGIGTHVLSQSDYRQWAKRIGYTLLIIGIAVLGGLLITRLFYGQFDTLFQKLVDSMALANTRFADGRMFYSYQFKNILIFGAMLVGSGAVFIMAARKSSQNSQTGVSRKAPTWGMLAVLLIAVDLMLASWGFNPASNPALLDFVPPSVQWLINNETYNEPFRYTTLENPSQHAPLLQANSTMRYGLDDIRGYDSIISAQYVDYMRETSLQNQLDFNRVAPLYLDRVDDVDWKRLRLLNVRYIVTHISTELPENLRTPIGREAPPLWPAYEDDVIRIWVNNYAYERAFIIYLYNDDLELDVNQVIRPGYANNAVIISDTGREKIINTHHEMAAWLVISETYDDGWRAYLQNADGSETQIEVERVFDNLQGINLSETPAGNYTIRVVYSPRSLQIGFFGTVISVALAVFFIGIWLWQLLIGASDESSSSVSRVARNSVAPIILNLFNRGIDFAFAFVMLRILGPEDAGIYYYAIIIFVWFDIFTNFGLDLLLIREASRKREDAGYIFLNTTYFRIFLMFACIPLLLGFLMIRQSFISDPLPSRGLLAIGLLYVGLAPGSISKGMTSLFYAFEKAEYPAAVTTITTINKAVFGVMALLMGFGIVGLAGVSIFTNIITLTILLWTGRKLIGKLQTRQPDSTLIKGMVGESWPLMLNHFLATIFFQIDIVLLEAMKGAAIVGKYSVAYRWLLALNIIPAFFTQALLPVMSRQANENRDALRRTYTLGVKLLVAIAVPLAVMFTFLAHGLTLILGGSEFVPEGAIALQIMIWSIPIGWINSLTQYALVAVDLQRRITVAFFIAVTFNITSNMIFIPQYGYQAAAITTIFSEMMLLVPFGILLQGALGKLAWVDMVWRPAVAGSIMLAIVITGQNISMPLMIVVGGVVYVGVMWVLAPLNAEERAMLSPLLPAKLRFGS